MGHERTASPPVTPTGTPAWAGLSSTEAASLLREHGENVLPRARPPSAWKQLAGQLFHFFALLLWAASGLAAWAGMPQLGIAIVLVILINGVFAFVQERRAERAAHRLGALLPRRAVVRRDDVWLELDARLLVVGDLLAIAAGDRISADLTVRESRGLLVDTSTLTGESVPVSLGEEADALAGSFVVEGEGLATVTATGTNTRLARIAELIRRERPRTPLARELDHLVRVIAAIALLIGAVFFAVGALIGLPIRSGFLFAIGVAVALVPEGLLPTVTLSLALGARRMARRGALVRRLEAVETLGSTTFICTDKTGTLTSNQMNVVEIWTPLGSGRVHGRGYEPKAELVMTPDVRGACARLALCAVRCSRGRALARDGTWVARGDPMEAALHALALRLAVDVERDERVRPLIAAFPFDPHRRRMSVQVLDEACVKGAADTVLPLCLGAAPIKDRTAEDAARAMAANGLRVIAVAARKLASGHPERRAAEIETDLELLGLVGLLDPPRPEVKAALAQCHRAGMRVAMVTGDHPGTAVAVAREVGLEVASVVTGDELPADDAMLGALIDRDGTIACRVSPEQKLRIAKALQARGHVVAMTGDGVNDGPALKQADIGIAMGASGTDVAREAADLVLLDDQFESIVQAVEQGRGTFANLRRFLTYHLTDNVAELTPFVIWALSGGRFPLALGVLQILCLDLLTDQLPALALGTEAPAPGALDESPRGERLVNARLLVRAFCVLGPAESVVELAAFIAVLAAAGFAPHGGVPASVLATASGAAFLAVVLGQSATAFACRSTSQPAWRISPRYTTALLGGVGASWAVVALLLTVPRLSGLLGQGRPPLVGFGCAALAIPIVLLADALHKRSLRSGAR
jgi:magnesium-transporting ATPase (P-type)